MTANVLKSFLKYLNSPSTRYSLSVGGLMYLAYGIAHQSLTNLTLIAVCVFIAIFMPKYAKLSNYIEEKVGTRTASVIAGRISRFSFQFLFNFTALSLVLSGGALLLDGIEQVGGITIVVLVTTLASLGAQYIGLFLSNRGYGDPNRNVLVGLSATIVVTAFATAGVPVIREFFVIAGSIIGLVALGICALSDLRAFFAPRHGIGMLFGTFNPIHKSHLALLKRALDERQLDHVYVHPTIVPKFYQRALARGEIRRAGLDGGLQVMEATEKADANVNYFPAGRKFYAPETRRTLIELALREAGLSGKASVLFLPEIYAERGFYGVIDEIRKMHPNSRLHGIHGSDYGGLAVRAILDECGWIYPFSVRRRDGISATAIRAGAKGMTSHIVEVVTEQLAVNPPTITSEYGDFQNDQGVLRAI